MTNHPNRGRRFPIGAGVRSPSGLLGEVVRMDSCPRGQTAVRFPTDRGPVTFWLPSAKLTAVADSYATALAWDKAEAAGETSNTRKGA